MKRLRKILILLFSFVFCICSFSLFFSNIKPTYCHSINLLKDMSIEQIAELEKYDGRDYGLVPKVKDQGSSNMCWAYACSNLAEVSILRSNIDSNATKDNLSFSPESLAKSVYLRGRDPLNNVNGWQCTGDYYNSSGNFLYGADVFSQWCAPVKEGTGGDYYINCEYHLTDCVEYSFLNSSVDYVIPIAKKAIAQYGAIAASYLNGGEHDYYNPKNENNGVAHAIIIIGWDDTIDKSLFYPGTTTRNGGWIVKNSYNSKGYFYMSYDVLLFQFMAVSFASKNEYQYNYFYDSVGSKSDNGVGGNTIYKTNKAANVFETKKSDDNNEYVKAVNVHFTAKNTTCKVEVYTNLTDKQNPVSGTLAGTGAASFEFGGYRTIKLDKPVKLDKNSYFSVVVEVSGSSDAKITCGNQNSNNSYVYTSYDTWNKINSGNTPRIKAYTALIDDKNEEEQKDIANANISLEYSTINYSGNENRPNVTLTYNGSMLIENEDYIINYTDNINVGQATITITGINNFFGQKVEYFNIVPLKNDDGNTVNSPEKKNFSTGELIAIFGASFVGIITMCAIVIIGIKKRKSNR